MVRSYEFIASRGVAFIVFTAGSAGADGAGGESSCLGDFVFLSFAEYVFSFFGHCSSASSEYLLSWRRSAILESASSPMLLNW